MSTKQIHVFISHAWAHSGHYDTLADWIFNGNWRVGQASLDFRNYSVPKDDPVHDADNDKQLKEGKRRTNPIYSSLSNSANLSVKTIRRVAWHTAVETIGDNLSKNNRPAE